MLVTMSFRVVVVVAVAMSLGCGPQVSKGESKGETGACELGALSCACRTDSTCDSGLVCVDDSCAEADTGDVSTSSSGGQADSEGHAATEGSSKVVCCHDEAYEEGASPYGHVYCDVEGLELGESCTCQGNYTMAGVGCEYGGEDRVPFCCFGEIAQCCAFGPPPLPGAQQDPWTVECSTCSCGTPETIGVGGPTRDPADAQCD